MKIAKKTAKKKLQDLIREELLLILNEKEEKANLTGIIIKFNANQPGTGHKEEKESTDFLQKSPFKFRDVVIPGNPSSGEATPTQEEADIWYMIVDALVKKFQSQGISDKDMNIDMPIIVLTEDPAAFPSGNNSVILDWNEKGVRSELMDPRYKLRYKDGIDPDAKGRGSSPWFDPVA